MQASVAPERALSNGAAAPAAAQAAGASGEQPDGALSVPSPSPRAAGTVAEHLDRDDATCVCAVLLPSGFLFEEGAQVWEGVRLGKLLGAGAQAKVFRLTKDDGSPTGKVIKINHTDPASKLLNNNVVWVGMDREWEIGTNLRCALQQPDGSLNGFMKVMDCVVSGGEPSTARFAGMLMGELYGWESYRRIETPEFHNIHYVREMLFQVFSALDRAQSRLGFVHADLGMRNVMEHYPRLWSDIPEAEAEAARAAIGTRPGWLVNADGSRFPLGPDVEFKIIDFGISKFSSKVAAAAAGREAQEVVEALHARWAGKQERIVFGCESDPTSIELAPADVTQPLRRWPNLRALLRRHKQSSTCTIRVCSKASLSRPSHAATEASAASAASLAPASGPASSAASGAPLPCANRLATRLASVGEATLKKAVAQCQISRRLTVTDRQTTLARQAAAPARKKKKSPIEKLYRSWWHRKGDVFHLLLTMALALDDRTWPEEDEDEVSALCSLLHHVTGIRLHASFVDADAASAALAAGGPFPYGRRKWQHWFRRWYMRSMGHVLPYNSGLLAREALAHPFFRAGEVRHAQVPFVLQPGALEKMRARHNSGNGMMQAGSV